jgi:general secretion pathway protein D
VLSKRALESSVIVDDSQVAVLGGLIQDSFADNSDRVPLLGDLPIIGALFRYDKRQRTKVNLLIFLKPTVVRTDSQGRTLTSDRYDYIMGEQDKSRPEPRIFWQDQTVPTLPPSGTMPGTPAGEISSTTVPPGTRTIPVPEFPAPPPARALPQLAPSAPAPAVMPPLAPSSPAPAAPR